IAFLRVSVGASTTSLVSADANGGDEHVELTRRYPSEFWNDFMVGANASNRPTWSPDALRIMLTGVRTGRANGSELVLTAPGSGTEKILPAPGEFWEVDAAWLTDSKALAIGAMSMLQWKLAVVDFADNTVTDVTRDLADYFGVSLTAGRDAAVSTRT